jgi:alpha,alpha-trehalase
MIKKSKDLAFRTTKLFTFSKDKDLTADDVAEAREYIAEYWKKLKRSFPKDEGSHIGVPHPFLVPSYAEGHEFDYDELYYWDSYFMVQGLLDAKHKDLNFGILDDLFFIFKRYKIIPNSSMTYMTSRSQPPFLTSFIFDLYYRYDPGKDWLKHAVDIARQEYDTVWMGERKPNARKIYQGLSRYYDFNYLHDIAETESGWDMTPRFNRKALNYLPIDLQALLYKYETDFARAARIFGKPEEAKEWERQAKDRKSKVNKLMWDKSRGLYYDFNYVKEKRGTIASLAAYYPMWAGMCDGRQAAELVRSLKRFENKGGLATTDSLPLGSYVPGSLPTQWAYPNGWAPLHFIVVKGLQRYGYHQDAKRIAMKWLRNNLERFNERHVFLEKYNVVSPDKPPAKGVYPGQEGFGWTNAVFERFCQEFIDNNPPVTESVQ